MLPSDFCQTQLWNKVSGDILLLEEGTMCHMVPICSMKIGIMVFDKSTKCHLATFYGQLFMSYVSDICTKWFQVTDGC